MRWRVGREPGQEGRLARVSIAAHPAPLGTFGLAEPGQRRYLSFPALQDTQRGRKPEGVMLCLRESTRGIRESPGEPVEGGEKERFCDCRTVGR